MDSRYHSISKALDGTCEWLFQRSEYNIWRDEENTKQQNGLLWIKGKPRAGKSSLMKTILNNILTQDTAKKPIILKFLLQH